MKGMKTGGRKKGSKNKINRVRDLAEAAAKGGTTPLEYMLSVMRDPKAKPSRRDEMARAAAPFLHARRAPEDSKGNMVPPVNYFTNMPQD